METGRDADWRHTAACRGLDVNLFFPAVGDGTTVKQALAVCNGDNRNPPCPAKEQCLMFAMSFEQDEDIAGIFGGLTSAERKRIRKERRTEQAVALPVTADRMADGDNFTYRLGLLLNLIHAAVRDKL